MSTTRSLAAASFAALALLAPAAAQAAPPPERPLARTHFTAPTAGEARLALTAAARGADWRIADRESAVLEVRVDGRYSQDVVLCLASLVTGWGLRPSLEGAPGSRTRSIGPVGPGRHTIGVTFNRAKSPSAVRKAKVNDLAPSLAPAGDVAARYAPILYDRDLPEIPGRHENNRTDVPLIEYHTRQAGSRG